MQKRRFPLFSEERLARVMRKGGMLVNSGGCWRVYRSKDKRSACVGHVLPTLAERMQGEGMIEPSSKRPDRYVWSGNANEIDKSWCIIPRPQIDAPMRQNRPRRSLLKRALEVEENPAAHVRLAAAANRYIGDVELAAKPQSLTMNWDNVRVDGGPASGSKGGFNGHSGAAQIRLSKLLAVLGKQKLAILDMMLLEGASCAALSRDLDVTTEEAARQAHLTLSSLAAAYDLNIRSL